MKRYLIVILFFFAAIIPMWADYDAQVEDDKYPEITFEETTHDFGLFDRANGDKVCWFVFKNTGDKELFIMDAGSTCGCTVPEFPKTAIMPGMKDSIKVSYSGSTRRVGKIKKTIWLTTNCKVNSSYLYILGEMVEELVADRVGKEER